MSRIRGSCACLIFLVATGTSWGQMLPPVDLPRLPPVDLPGPTVEGSRLPPPQLPSQGYDVSRLPPSFLPRPVVDGSRQALPEVPKVTPGSVVLVREGDGPERQAHLFWSWRTPEGSWAHQVQLVQTKEMLTIVERKSTSGRGQSASVQIYHWGASDVPPPDAPVPLPAGIRQASRSLLEDSGPRPLPPGTPLPAPTLATPSVPNVETKVPFPGNTAVPLEQHPGEPGCTLERSSCLVPCGSCRLEHYSEQPPRIAFKPGGCLPVSPPSEAPSYGYYPTQWHPYPGTIIVGEQPVQEPWREPLPSPSFSAFRGDRPTGTRGPGWLPNHQDTLDR